MKKRLKLPDIPVLLRSHFFSGLLILIPLAVIVWMLLGALHALWQLHNVLPQSWQPDFIFRDDPAVATLFDGMITIGCALVLALGVSVLGWSSKHYLGRKMLETIGELIQHIPVIRSVYSALDQLLKTLAAGGGQQFNRVVYVEYPRRGMWTLAFVTGHAKGLGAPPDHLNIYVPTTPNPTSGFHLIVPEAEVRESHMKVEDAFRTILSLGIAQPDITPNSHAPNAGPKP